MSRKTSKNSLGVVEKLIEQRRLFQDWLAKLDSGVEAMPPRVVERVRNDYRGRLQTVLAELAEQQDIVREALSESEARHAELEQQQQAKREELAELKLRRHVGEVDDADFRESNALLKQAIDALSKELGAALRDIERFEEILEAILRDQEPPTTPEPEPEPEPEPVPEPVMEEEVPPETEPAEEPVAVAEEPMDEGEIIIPVVEEESPPRAPPPAHKPAVEDELAFLRSVTTTMPPVKAPRGSRAERARGGRANLAPEPQAETDPESDPFAAADDAVAVEPSPSRRSAEMQAPVLEEPPEELEAAAHMVDLPPAPEEEPPPAASEQPEATEEKSLICGECGATNRPTEWYCEKCGAELSAL